MESPYFLSDWSATKFNAHVVNSQLKIHTNHVRVLPSKSIYITTNEWHKQIYFKYWKKLAK